jgi:beta-galactosidase
MNIPFRGFLVLLACSLQAHAGRESIPLREDWKFIRENAGVAASSESWQRVSLPHTWNAEDAQEGPASVSAIEESAEDARSAIKVKDKAIKKTGDPHLESGYYRGACWYEHILTIPAEWKGKKRFFIRFGAAGTVAKTYINKTLLGEHRGGFTAFCYELTNYLNYGETNELRVEVDNTHREDLPPLSGDFNLYGGLYRQAELIVTDLNCITPLDYASPGVYLTPRSITEKEALVEIRTLVSDGHKEATKIPRAMGSPSRTNSGTRSTQKSHPFSPITVRTEVHDANGQLLATLESEQNLSPQETKEVTQNLAIPSPHLWSGRKDPYLYSVTVSLLTNGVVVDKVTQPLGLRTVTISQDRGFLLNGRPYPVYGVNRHQDVRNKGWAVLPEDEERDASLMREMGVTAVRNAHYPQSENWHCINDREGVLLWDEVSLVNETRDTREFLLNSEEFLREMIHQLYNHPSVAWWGIFNELGSKPMAPCNPLLSRLQSVAKEIDPNRLVVAASCNMKKPFNQVPEQIGMNAYPGWYSTNSPSFLTTKIASFSQEVGKRIAISEYGAGANIAHHAEGRFEQPEPQGSFHPEEWQALIHEGDWAVLKSNPNLWGTFVWNMFDFACKRRSEGNTPSLNDKGLVTHDRKFRKDAFYFYKANWNPEPMVRITSSRMTRRTIATTEVKVYSNCKDVELMVNGKAIGTTHPDNIQVCRFPGVTLAAGSNMIEAIGHHDGKSFTDTCTWILEPNIKAP